MNELLSLQAIFTDKLFRIPVYQRGYAWTIDQLKDFWEDVHNLPFTAEEKYHYTGMISIKKVPKEIWNNWNDEKWAIEGGSLKPYYVVDGQQRLTTFIIAIFEICNLILNLEENKNKDKRDIYFVEGQSIYDIEKMFLFMKKTPDSAITTYKFGYEEDNPSFSYFINKTLESNNLSEVTETFYTLNLENAKKFFRDNIRNLYDENGINALIELYLKLTQKLVFNVSEIKDGFNEYVAFETINNRGKKLSNLELLKNRLIYLVSLYSNEECPEDEKSKLVDNINEAWKEVYKYLGKNKKAPLNDDDFLMNHWIIYFKYSRKKGEAYRDFLLNEEFTVQNIYDKVTIKTESIEEFKELRDVIEDETEESEYIEQNGKIARLKPIDIQNYVNSIMKMAPIWFKVNYPESIENSEEKKWLDKLTRIGFMYFKPIVVVSYLNDKINHEDRIKLFKKIERHIFITFKTTGALSTFGNSEIYALTNQIYRDSKKLDDLYEALDNKISGWLIDNSGYYKIDSFKARLDRLFEKNEGYYSWSALRYFLYEYELYLMEKRGMVPKIEWNLFLKNESDRVSIEHVLPRTPSNEYWQNRFQEYDENEMKRLTNTLGNLLALSQSINSSLQNDDFDSKKNLKIQNNKKVREGYVNGSYQEIEVSQNNEWTIQEILNRGMKLLDFMEERWDIKFKSINAKRKLLCLEFLFDDIIDDEYDDDTIVNRENKRTKINLQMAEVSYKYFKKIANNEITHESGIEAINNESGMNPNSARMYYSAYKNMIIGQRYTKQVNGVALEYYLKMIKDEYGENGLKLALKSVSFWMDYAKEFNITILKEKELLEKYNYSKEVI